MSTLPMGFYSAPPLLVVKPFSYSPADPLLKAYLDESRLTPAGTPHGFRLG